jgi:hypothetical protein
MGFLPMPRPIPTCTPSAKGMGGTEGSLPLKGRKRHSEHFPQRQAMYLKLIIATDRGKSCIRNETEKKYDIMTFTNYEPGTGQIISRDAELRHRRVLCSARLSNGCSSSS